MIHKSRRSLRLRSVSLLIAPSRALVVTIAGILSLAGPSARAAGKDCLALTAEGEAFNSAQSYTQAETTLKSAIQACEAAHQSIPNPYIALGKTYFDSGRCAEAIPQFEAALKRAPGLELAYLDLSACYTQTQKFEKAIEAGKHAVDSKDSHMAFMANYNVALAYFNIAANKDDRADLRSEPYFKKASELNPSFGGSAYYLGVLAESSGKPVEVALPLYQKGCAGKFKASCDSVRRIASVPADAAAPGAGE